MHFVVILLQNAVITGIEKDNSLKFGSYAESVK